MRTIVAALGIALLTTLLALSATPSSAQFRSVQQGDKKDDGEARAKERKSSDHQYKSAIERLPDQKYDPWRNLR